MMAGGRRIDEARDASAAPALLHGAADEFHGAADEFHGVADDDEACWTARPCPLCRGEIDVLEQLEPQAVLCPSCGLSCTIVAPPPPKPAPVAESGEGDATSSEGNVLRWLERQPPRPASLAVSARMLPAPRRRTWWRPAALAATVIAAIAGILIARRSTEPRDGSFDGAAADAAEFTDGNPLVEADRILDLQRRQGAEAEARRKTAEREVRRVTAKYLAAKADCVLPPDSLEGVALAVEAMQATMTRGEPVVPEAHQALRDALGRCGAAHRIDGITLRGHVGAVAALAITPDGRWLATGGDDQIVRLWDLHAAATSVVPIELRRHRARVNNLAVSPDGRWLATASRDSTVCLWDLASANPAQAPIVLAGHRHPITGMRLSPDGRWLATYCANADGRRGAAQLWDLARRAEISAPVELAGVDGVIRDAAISADNRWLALAVDQSVRLWDLATSEPAVAARDLHLRQGAVQQVRFTSDSRWIVACTDRGAYDAAVRLWPLAGADPSASLTLATGMPPVRALAASADGRWLAAAGDGDAVTLWELNTASGAPRRMSLVGASGPHAAVAFSKNGRWLASIGNRGAISLWSLSSTGAADAAVVLRSGQNELHAAEFSPDGRWLVAAGSGGAAQLWTLDVEALVDDAAALASRAPRRSGAAADSTLAVGASVVRRALEFAQNDPRGKDLSRWVGATAERAASQWLAMVAYEADRAAVAQQARMANTMRPGRVTNDFAPAAAATPAVIFAPAVVSVERPIAATPRIVATAASADAARSFPEPIWQPLVPMELPPVDPAGAGPSEVTLVGPELTPPAPESGPRSIVTRIVKAITPQMPARSAQVAPRSTATKKR